MNSNWPLTPFPKPPNEYSKEYMDQLVRAIEDTLTRARSVGPLQVEKVNITNLPTSSAGLRTGDLWNDSGTVKIV